VSVLGLHDGPPGDAQLIGGKALGLARLLELELPVPPAVVLTADAHERWREHGRVADEDKRALAAAVEPLGAPLAVRSSAADEDTGERAAAGQYDSVMGVRGLDGVLAAVEHCWRQAEQGRANAYRGGAPPRVALVLQREVIADRAGIAFSADPITGASDAVLIEAVFGHGEGAVGGTLSPDRYRVARSSSAVSARVADKVAAADGAGSLHPLARERRTARALRDDEARAVAALADAAERGLGRPVDIEFCFERGALWAVQCRPITTLA
jgi:phosphoenolpyruvate synthase/pyruvate phosphate dikinase